MTEELLFVYEAGEAAIISEMLVEEAIGLSRTQALLNQAEPVSEESEKRLDDWLERLLHHEPVQYVLGHTWFYGLKFKVGPGVLIPRRETEELVDLVIKENATTEGNVLDVGTGSGCIAISVKKNLPQLKVTAIDISVEALEIAEENSRELDARVRFVKRDILQWRSGNAAEKFDIIVSNPPYVTEADRKLMSKNVVDFEPATALFVSDSNPLLFYREITDYALLHLNSQGKLYFEINESCGRDMEALLQQAGFEQIRLIKDMQGKDRYIAGCLR